MGTDSVFIWAQIIGFCAMSICILAWQLKNPRHIILCFVPACSLWAVQYILLGAYLGAVMNICSVFKDGALGFVRNSLVPYVIGAFLLAIWGTGLYFFEHWFDILPLIGGSIINLSLLFRDNRSVVARGGIVGQICWIAYNLIVGAWMGVACGVLMSLSSIIAMARYEEWQLGKCFKTFPPSFMRSLFVFPNFRTYP